MQLSSKKTACCNGHMTYDNDAGGDGRAGGGDGYYKRGHLPKQHHEQSRG